MFERGSCKTRERLEFIEVPPTSESVSFEDAVAEGLAREQKELPARFFYDKNGSRLFEEITNLGEYYPTRTEESILIKSADDIVASVDQRFCMMEFGSGSSCKTRRLIEAAIERQGNVRYMPIDISGEFLRASSISLLEDYSSLEITALAAEYFDAIESLPKTECPRLILFLGSNIGNFSQAEAHHFLERLAMQMKPSDRFLLGADLVKDHAVIEAAYNDPKGVTEEFNKNILARINRELGGQFDLSKFEHRAPYLADHQRIEMWLVSTEDQWVRIDKLKKSFQFKKDEHIHTENSHKYTVERVEEMAHRAGLKTDRVWTDEKNWFGLFLLKLDV